MFLGVEVRCLDSTSSESKSCLYSSTRLGLSNAHCPGLPGPLDSAKLKSTGVRRVALRTNSVCFSRPGASAMPRQGAATRNNNHPAPPHQRGLIIVTITLRGHSTRQLSLTPLVRTTRAGRRSPCSATPSWDCRSNTTVLGNDHNVVVDQSMDFITSYTPSFATNFIFFSWLRRLTIPCHTVYR
jgi:hypothetical protein